MSDVLQMAQLLCTRLCHDLAGPVGAVSAGVELMGSDPSLVDDETLALLSGSAEAAARKLKFLRIAFGWPGSGSSPLSQVGSSFEDYIGSIAGPSGGPILHWPAEEFLASFTDRLVEESAQTIANVVLVALEVQPRCRTLAVNVNNEGGVLSVSVENRTSEGAARKRGDISDAVCEGLGEMTPRTVQAHMANQLVLKTGGRVDIEVVSDGVITTARWQ